MESNNKFISKSTIKSDRTSSTQSSGSFIPKSPKALYSSEARVNINSTGKRIRFK